MPGDAHKIGGVEVEVVLDFERLERQKSSELPQRMRRVGKEAGRALGERTVDEFLDAWRTTMRRLENASKVDLARGLIDKKEFERRGREMGEAFQRALLREIDSRKKAGTLDTTSFNVLAEQLDDIGAAGPRAAAGTGRLNEVLTTMVTRIAEVNPAVGRLVSVMGSMALGSVFMAGLLGGLAALAAGWRKLTEGAREAKQRTEEAIESLRELARQRALGPAGEVPDQAVAAVAEVDRLRAELARARKFEAASPAQRRVMTESGGRPRSVEDVERDIDALVRLGIVAIDTIDEAEDEAARTAEDRRIANLASLIASNQATEKEMASAREILAEEQRKLADLAKQDPTAEILEQRAQALQRSRLLEGALEGTGSRDAQRLEALEADMRTRLLRLTATAQDDLLAQINKMEAEAREAAAKAGVAISEEFVRGLEALRTDAELQGRLEVLRGEFATLMQGEGSETADAASGFIESLREEASTLAEGSSIRAAYLKFVEDAEAALKRLTKALADKDRAQDESDDRDRREAERARKEELRKLREMARLLEENARAAIQLANAFGLVSDETMAALNNLTQLGSAVYRIIESIGPGLEFDFSAIPLALGAAAQLAKGLFGGGGPDIAEKEREIQLDQIKAMQELERALRDLEGALLHDVSARERDELVAYGDQLMMGAQYGYSPQVTGANLRFAERIKEITGIDVLSEDGLRFDAKKLAAALDFLRGWDLGSFTDDLMGNLDAMAWLFSILGDAAGTAAERVEAFLKVLEEGGATEFATEFRRILEEEGVEAANEYLDGLAARFAAGDQSLFAQGGIFYGLTAEEAMRIFEEGNALLEEWLSTSGGGTAQSLTRTRTVTEMTAQQAIALDMTRNELLRGIIQRMDAAGPLAIPSAALVTSSPAVSSSQVSFQVGNIIGEVSVQAPGGVVDRADLTRAMQAAADELVDYVDRGLALKYDGRLRAIGK